MRRLLTLREFREIIPKICRKDTSADPDNWTPDNPLWGHCAIVAVLVQDLFDGTILRASLEGTPFAHMRSHYWNDFCGISVDFTADQFDDSYPQRLRPEVSSREHILDQHPDTTMRYNRLKERLYKKMFGHT